MKTEDLVERRNQFREQYDSRRRARVSKEGPIPLSIWYQRLRSARGHLELVSEGRLQWVRPPLEEALAQLDAVLAQLEDLLLES